MGECVVQVKKALRGDDNTFLAFNSFLAKNVGFGKEDDHILRTFIYDSNLRSYQP